MPYHCKIFRINDNDPFCDLNLCIKSPTFDCNQAHLILAQSAFGICENRARRCRNSENVSKICVRTKTKCSSCTIFFRPCGTLSNAASKSEAEMSARRISDTSIWMSRTALGAFLVLARKVERALYAVVDRVSRPAMPDAMLSGSAMIWRISGVLEFSLEFRDVNQATIQRLGGAEVFTWRPPICREGSCATAHAVGGSPRLTGLVMSCNETGQ